MFVTQSLLVSHCEDDVREWIVEDKVATELSVEVIVNITKVSELMNTKWILIATMAVS